MLNKQHTRNFSPDSVLAQRKLMNNSSFAQLFLFVGVLSEAQKYPQKIHLLGICNVAGSSESLLRTG